MRRFVVLLVALGCVAIAPPTQAAPTEWIVQGRGCALNVPSFTQDCLRIGISTAAPIGGVARFEPASGATVEVVVTCAAVVESSDSSGPYRALHASGPAPSGQHYYFGVRENLDGTGDRYSFSTSPAAPLPGVPCSAGFDDTRTVDIGGFGFSSHAGL